MLRYRLGYKAENVVLQVCVVGKTVTWCFSICAPLMHSALPFYSFWPVSKSGEVSVPKIAFGAGYRLLFYPTGIRL